MSYDPHRHQGAGGPPWAIQTYQEQPGYGDAFDGAQAHAGAQNYAGHDGYPAQDGYAEPFAGAQDGGYRDPQGGYRGGFDNSQNGYGNQVGYGQPQYDQPQYDRPQYDQSQYGPPQYGAPAGYQDPRSSGPMLSAPDVTRWDGFGGAELDQESADDDAPGVMAGGVMGFVAAGAAIGIATLAAAFFRPQASPIIAVGEWFIDHTPSWLKNFAVAKFGEHDKTMLLLGMYVTIAFIAIGIGVMARRRTVIGVVGVAAFGLFGAYIAYTRPASRFSDVIPSIIGGVAGVAALLWLAHAAAAEADRLSSGRAGRSARPGRHGGTRAVGGWA